MHDGNATSHECRERPGWPGRRRAGAAIAVFAAWLASGGRASAQIVDLTISPTSFSFPSADPDIVPSVTAPTTTVSYRVRQNQGGSWRLTLLANGDLLAGAASIPIGNVTWTASPAPPFQGGTLSKTVEQTVASGSNNANPTQNGSVVFQLVNSWSYSVGTYSQTLVFTISAP